MAEQQFDGYVPRTFSLFGGEISAYRPESAAAEGGLLSVVNMDLFDEKQSLAKVPGCAALSASHGAALSSLHYYERVGRDFQKARSLLSLAADGVLRNVNLSTGALTTLYSGLTAARLVDVKMLGTLFLSGPAQYGLTTGGLRYDGDIIGPWGLLGPSDVETVLEPFDGGGTYTATEDLVLTSDTVRTKHTTPGLSVQKTGTLNSVVTITHSTAALDYSAADSGIGLQWVYIPSSMFRVLSGSASSCFTITLLSNSDAKSSSYYFQLGELGPGWNQLVYVLASPDTSTGGGVTLTAVTKVTITITLAAATSTFSGLVLSKQFKHRNGAPTAAQGSAGNVTGAVSYRVLFVRSDGKRSNGGSVSNTVSVTNKIVNLTSVPVSPDADVVAREIYRDLAGDSVFLFAGTIADNVTTTFADNVAAASLGEPDMPLAAQDGLDASVPPFFSAVTMHGNRIVGIDAENPTTLVIGEVGEPEEFRLLDRLSVEEQLTGLQQHAFGTLLFSGDRTLILTGDGVDNAFSVSDVSSEIGANNAYASVRVRNDVVVMREAEVSTMQNPADPYLINHAVEDQFLALEDAGSVEIVLDRSRRRLVFIEPGVTTMHTYQYGGGADPSDSDPLNLRTGRWGKIVLPDSIVPVCAVVGERTSNSPELWLAAEDGYIYHLQRSGTKTWELGAGGFEVIEAGFRTHVIALSTDIAGTGFPKFARVNGSATVGSTWTLTLRVFSDLGAKLLCTKTKTFTVGADGTAPILRLPRIGVRGSYMDIEVTNSGQFDDGSFRSITLFVQPTADFRGPRPR